MQEEITQRVVSFSTKGAKLTEEALKKAILAMVRKIREEPKVPKVGRNSLKKLTGRDGNANMVEVGDRLPEFERFARKYKVRYSIQKDPTSTPVRWQVFFKANQADAMMAAFTAYTKSVARKQAKPSLLGKLRKNIEAVRNMADKERNRDHGNRER